MRKVLAVFLLTLFTLPGWAQGEVKTNGRGLLQAFHENAQWHPDFAIDNLEGWILRDLDGLETGGPWQEFPHKGEPMAFITYNPSLTVPVNTAPEFQPRSGNKVFISFGSSSGASNDWLITKELAPNPGGVFSFYAKGAFDFFGNEEFKVGYSTTGTEVEDFILFNDGNTYTSNVVWTRYEFEIPSNAKHIAINCVSYAYLLMVDDIEFVYNVEDLAPAAITAFSSEVQLGDEIVATLNWTNPLVDNALNTLGELTGVKIYRGTHPMNLELIADLPNPGIGETMSYTDNAIDGSGFFTYRIEPYNNSGQGVPFTIPLIFFGYETTPAAPANIVFTHDATFHNVISWEPVITGAMGGELENPVTGYTIIRALGTQVDTLAIMNSGTSFTETEIPEFNLYTYTIIAQTSATNLGIPAVISDYSGMGENQQSVTSGTFASNQAFELNRPSILTQSIYMAEQIGETGLITSLSYFSNLGGSDNTSYKIYMSATDRTSFGVDNASAIWEFYGTQKLVYEGPVDFQAGRNALTIALDQPYYYDASSNKNVIITIIKPLITTVPSINPRDFYNTPVDDNRTYFAIGYGTDLSIITQQPAVWSTDPISTIPSIATTKINNYGSFSGVVTAEDGISFLENVAVSIAPAEGNETTYQVESTLTDINGSYSVPALLPGSYTVIFTKDTYSSYEAAFTVDINQQFTMNVSLIAAIPVVITGTVVDAEGTGISGATIALTGFSGFTTTSDESGSYLLDAFAEKSYTLKATHPLYMEAEVSFISEEADFVLDPVILALNPHKPLNVVAVNENSTGMVSWDVPAGFYNETMMAWGSSTNTGDGWGNGGDEFVSGIRFETTDLQSIVPENGKLTHVKAYISNYAEIIIEISEGANGAALIYSQPESISEEGWYTFELSRAISIDTTKELWIGIHYLPGQYGAYPIGIDEGPNAPSKKGSMLFVDGAWNQMSLTNKNWNIYGILNNAIEANPSGYSVFRKLTNTSAWTCLTSAIINTTSYEDISLGQAEAGIYHYGVSAVYGTNMASDTTISNDVLLNMVFDLTILLTPDFSTPAGAYVSVWNGEHFMEQFVGESQTSVTFNDVWRGEYNISAELENFAPVELSDILVDSAQTIEIPMLQLKCIPSNLSATVIMNSASIQLDWTLHAQYTDRIETYPDFERESISNYVLRDVDGLETYTYTNFSWPLAGTPMSFMVMNPFSTTPVVDMAPYSGRRFLTALAGPDGASNDWLVIPAGKGNFSFMAASLSASGLEKFRVLHSATGTDPSDFTAIGNTITAPADWNEYAFEAPAGTKYMAINYIGNDTYILKVDDIAFQKEYTHALSYNVYVDGIPAGTNITGTSFELEDLISGERLIEVEAVYSTGISERAQISIVYVGIGESDSNNFRFYPNPNHGTFSLKLAEKSMISIADLTGKVFYTNWLEAGESKIDLNVTPGSYILSILSSKGTTSQKLIIL